MCIEGRRTAFWRVHKDFLYQGVTRDWLGRVTHSTYGNMTRFIDGPAAALFHTTEATSSDTWPWAKVECMGYKPSSEDFCEVQLKMAANDTVQLVITPVPCFDPNKSTFYIFGSSCSTREVSDMAIAADYLKSVHVLPNLSNSELRKLLLQLKKTHVRVIFFQCAAYHTLEEMFKATSVWLQREVKP